MNISRRGFLTGMLALGIAPAIVRADSLMRVIPLDAALLPLPTSGSILEGASAKAVRPGVREFWGKSTGLYGYKGPPQEVIDKNLEGPGWIKLNGGLYIPVYQ